MIINLLYRYILFISFSGLTQASYPLSKHTIYPHWQRIRFRLSLGTVAAMERENISYRLQSGKAQYITKSGKNGYCKPKKKKKAEQYSGILKLLSKNYPIKMVSKLEGVSVSTVQRLKKEFCL